MKPTRGRTSTQPRGEDAIGLSVHGALARTVTDSALLLDAIQGTTTGDVFSAPAPRGSFHQAALTVPDRPLRVAVSRKSSTGRDRARCRPTSASPGSEPRGWSTSSGTR